MRRREFIKLFFLGTLCRSRVAMAQRSGRVPLVVVLTPYEETGRNVFTPISRGAFDQALRELNWIDGHNIRIDYRDAGGDLELLRNIANELVKLRPDVIVAVNTPLVAAVLDQTHTIPVVFGLVPGIIGPRNVV